MAKKPHPVEEHEARQIARASYFTTAEFLGSGQYRTTRFDTVDAARAAAKGMQRVMVYAVTPEGFTVPVAKEARA